MTRVSDVAVRCADVSIARGSTRVVDGVSFRIAPGGGLAVMGPTGSGKSSLAAALAGEEGLSIAGGVAEVVGVPVQARGRKARVRAFYTGFLAQRAELAPRMTVGEIVGGPVTSRDRRVNQRALELRVAALLEELHLPFGVASKYPYELSSGMRQRVALARALVLDPKVLIADELYANLDPEVRLVVADAVRRRREESGMAVLAVTNDASVVEDLDAEVLVLRGGHVVGLGARLADVQWTPDEATRA